jgi:hypothetical protein
MSQANQDRVQRVLPGTVNPLTRLLTLRRIEVLTQAMVLLLAVAG